MKKRIVSMLMALVMALSMVTSAGAANAQQQNTADALNYLQLFLGTGNNADGTPNYALDSNLTREQGVMLLLRMLGKLDEAEKCTAAHPFKDVSVKYYDKYLAYAYSTKLTAGVSATSFGFGEPMTEQMFLTFCLRALEYTDGEQANYVWNNAYALARANGLLNSLAQKTNLLRADAIELFWNALKTDLFGGSKTLAQKLVDEGVFSEKDYLEACAIERFGKEAAQRIDCAHQKTTSKITEKPTCTESGVRTYYCAECGAKLYTRGIPALGHSEKHECNAEKHWLECSICGEKSAVGTHTFNSSGVCTICGYGCTHSFRETVTEPTCKQGGYTMHTCSKCGYQHKDTFTPAAEHSYVSVVTKKATCTETGVTTFTCSKCADFYEKNDIPALGHDYEAVITKQATAKEDGIKTYTCKNCKHQYTETIPATGGTTELLKWEEYQALSGPEKDAYFASFANPMDFVKWMQEAQAEYNKEHPVIEIKPGDVIDLGNLK